MPLKVVASAFRIMPEAAVPSASVERLYDRVFGPARFEKASHCLRAGRAPIANLCWIADEEGSTVGAIRYWPISVGEADEPALLLGPLAVAPARARQGIGTALVRKTLSLAAQAHHDLVFLVGDTEYYRRFGFVPAAPRGFSMPGEPRPDRLQVLSLKRRGLDRPHATLQPALGRPQQLAVAVFPRAS